MSSGRTIGSIIYRRYSNNGYGDFEIASVTNSSFTTTNRVLTGDSLIGAIFYPSVGTTVKFYGSSTGRIGAVLHGISTSLTKVYVYFTPYGNNAGFSVQWQ